MNVIYLVTIITGVLSLILGYLIKYKHIVEIISGYDEKIVIDKEGLAKWVGSNIILMGILAFPTLALEFLLPTITIKISLIYSIGIVGLISIRIAIGCKKYEKS